MAHVLNLLSAGAAKAVVLDMQAAFEAATGATLQATFGAVGAMREAFVAGAPCDVLVLSAALLDDLATAGALDVRSRVSLGLVGTGIAVRADAPRPPIGNADQLRQALRAASALYLPDPARATAGIHCVDVLRRLGILDTMQPRLRPFPNGAVAMRQLADDTPAAPAIGCTQVTEILYTRGVTLVGALPAGFDLNTDYGAAIVTRATAPGLAAQFVAALAGEATLAARRAGGFEC